MKLKEGYVYKSGNPHCTYLYIGNNKLKLYTSDNEESFRYETVWNIEKDWTLEELHVAPEYMITKEVEEFIK